MTNASDDRLYWTTAKTTIAPILVAATSSGVCCLVFLTEKWKSNALSNAMSRAAPSDSNDIGLRQLAQAHLAEYFPKLVLQYDESLCGWLADIISAIDRPREPRGDVPLDIRSNAKGNRATSFQKKIWAQLCRIPCGELRSYKDIAIAIGQPKATQAVGGANKANIIPVLIPCHRVVNVKKAGADKPGLGGYAYGKDLKQALLEREGAW